MISSTRPRRRGRRTSSRHQTSSALARSFDAAGRRFVPRLFDEIFVSAAGRRARACVPRFRMRQSGARAARSASTRRTASSTAAASTTARPCWSYPRPIAIASCSVARKRSRNVFARRQPQRRAASLTSIGSSAIEMSERRFPGAGGGVRGMSMIAEVRTSVCTIEASAAHRRLPSTSLRFGPGGELTESVTA